MIDKNNIIRAVFLIIGIPTMLYGIHLGDMDLIIFSCVLLITGDIIVSSIRLDTIETKIDNLKNSNCCKNKKSE